VRPRSLYVVKFCPVLATSVKLLDPVFLCTLNPVSLVELSVHCKFICVVEASVTVKFVGANGISVVFAVLSVDHPESKSTVEAKAMKKIFIVHLFNTNIGKFQFYLLSVNIQPANIIIS
jgi:hypothetical protein